MLAHGHQHMNASNSCCMLLKTQDMPKIGCQTLENAKHLSEHTVHELIHSHD